ncbi:DsbA family oxidoreductase [Solicola gregarius]|uniref:DsbA family oxidoreductase n=1 Tax=Solicola gregarius TaxID=2908642 RepID=A0AA46TKB4_9ACTN|nr:DsbA family oxidoreductase [Solicola gregarius]UYM06861.1 DsbA family oxidoreductase [Solicola gregarius]
MFSDVVCPWCYIGVTRFERAAAAVTLSTGTEIEVTLRSYQLDPDAQSSGEPLVDALGAKFGGPEQVAAMVERVRAAGRPDGLDFDFQSAVAANTYDAHRLLTWTAAHAGAGAQGDLAHELWRAHFVEGADVADHDTLAARAALVGLDAERVDEVLASGVAGDEVTMQREAAHDLDIRSVPTFVIDNRWMITGAQPQDAIERALRELVTAEQ